MRKWVMQPCIGSAGRHSRRPFANCLQIEWPAPIEDLDLDGARIKDDRGIAIAETFSGDCAGWGVPNSPFKLMTARNSQKKQTLPNQLGTRPTLTCATRIQRRQNHDHPRGPLQSYWKQALGVCRAFGCLELISSWMLGGQGSSWAFGRKMFERKRILGNLGTNCPHIVRGVQEAGAGQGPPCSVPPPLPSLTSQPLLRSRCDTLHAFARFRVHVLGSVYVYVYMLCIYEPELYMNLRVQQDR